MTKIVLGLWAFLLWPLAAAAQKSCDSVFSFQHNVATGPVEVVPGNATKRIYMCGWVLVQKGNTLNFQLFSGAGKDCSTDKTAISPVIELPSDFAFSTKTENVGPPLGYGQSLCMQTTGTNGKLTGFVYWSQF